MGTPDSITIRPEEPGDYDAVAQVNEAAFERPAEAKLVNALRELAYPVISLVATIEDQVVGHILFTPVIAEEALISPGLIMGLAPMAVVPGFQRKGVGSQLVEAGLDACVQLGCTAIVVLGHPEYYPRFGFAPASRFGIRCEYEVPDEVFMAVELVPDALEGCHGLVTYHPAFADVE